MIFIDSNIWCYYFDRSAKEHSSATKAVEKVLGKEDIAMNTLVGMEISHFLIKNLGPVEGKEKVEQLLAFPFVVREFDYELFLSSVEMLARYSHTGIGGRDATILATMKRLGIKKLLTHDRAFQKVDFIEVVDPVRRK